MDYLDFRKKQNPQAATRYAFPMALAVIGVLMIATAILMPIGMAVVVAACVWAGVVAWMSDDNGEPTP